MTDLPTQSESQLALRRKRKLTSLTFLKVSCTPFTYSWLPKRKFDFSLIKDILRALAPLCD